MNYTELFNENGYVHLVNFLDADNAEQLTKELKNIVRSGITIKDTQCPKSEAIRDVPVFDSLLEQLLPHMELATGKKLLPTYAYTRLYQPGEVLKPHRDRPACEISATVTLGFSGDPWPIFMADLSAEEDGESLIAEHEEKIFVKNKAAIAMNPGDAVVYKGCEKIHWREEFHGDWAAQVFLHYVDANGPYTNHIFDGRKCLAHQTPPERGGIYRVLEKAFSKESCDRIIQQCESLELEQAGIGVDKGIIDKTIRDVRRVTLPTYLGIGATMSGIGLAINSEHYNFNVTRANQVEFLKYDIDGHYHAHIDISLDPEVFECRKLTVLLFLNDDFEGGKLFIQNGDQKTYPPQSAGTVVIFPSFLMHGVEPVTSGIRRSLVTWMVGPWFQ